MDFNRPYFFTEFGHWVVYACVTIQVWGRLWAIAAYFYERKPASWCLKKTSCFFMAKPAIERKNNSTFEWSLDSSIMHTLSWHLTSAILRLSVVEAQLAEIDGNMSKKTNILLYQQTFGTDLEPTSWKNLGHFPNGKVVLTKHKTHKKRRLYVLVPLSWNSKTSKSSHNLELPRRVEDSQEIPGPNDPSRKPIGQLGPCLGSKCKPCRPCQRSLSMCHPQARSNPFTARPAGSIRWVHWRFLVEPWNMLKWSEGLRWM